MKAKDKHPQIVGVSLLCQSCQQPLRKISGEHPLYPVSSPGGANFHFDFSGYTCECLPGANPEREWSITAVSNHTYTIRQGFIDEVDARMLRYMNAGELQDGLTYWGRFASVRAAWKDFILWAAKSAGYELQQGHSSS